MNAFTASDHTYYPFATTNPQDFKNLMSVYLDATLHPLLKKTDFAQEGWRIGPENPDAGDPDSKLVFKGVVYNEMKGQMSDASYLFYIRFQDHIFPSINNSGGDPQKITDLTYEQLKKFHAEHYHPSNAKVFTYGDMPLADHLRGVDAQLQSFERIRADVESKLPISLSDGPQEVQIYGPLDPLVDPDKQFKTSVSWVTGDTSDIVESFSMALISTLLMDGYGSPLYRGLIETGLGTDWSPNSGYDGSAKVGIFSIGLTGVREENVAKVKDEIKKILQTVRDKGFERSKIDGHLHQLELGLKHKTANFGLSLLHRLKPKWFTGVDPFQSLAWNETISAFERELSKGNYLEGLMDKYLLNDNCLTFTMAPSPTFSEELVKEEETRLATKVKEASTAIGDEAKAKALFQKQESELLVEQSKSNSQDVSCLPSVHVRDIPRQKEGVVVRDDEVAGVKTQWREAHTNGLTYFRAINVLANLPDELRQFIPLFADSIMRLGTKNETMEQLEDLIKLKTGGISVGYHSSPSPTDFQDASEGLMIAGMALDRNVPDMFELLRKVIVDTDFDSPAAAQRIRQLLHASADGVVNDIASSGHSYARGFAESGLTRNAFLREQVGGLSQVRLVTSLASRPDSDQLEDVIDKLKRIQQAALAGPTFRAAITCGSESIAENSGALSRFLLARPGGTVTLPEGKPATPYARNIKTFFPLPYQVYYGGLALPTAAYTSKDGAPLQILAQLLTHKHLHHEIREKGGAYGGGAYSRPLDGLFGFYSYRDPNPQNTLSIMRGAGNWAVDKKWSDGDLEEAKISVFQGVDAPKAVNEEGMARFLSGVTDEMQQTRREQLLDVTKDQVRDVAQRYLVDAIDKGKERVVFLGERLRWVDDSWAIEELNVNGS